MQVKVSLTSAQAWQVLAALPGLGPVSIMRAYEHFGRNVDALMRATEEALRKVKGLGPQGAHTLSAWESHVDIALLEAECKKKGVEFIDWTDVRYPPLLSQIYDPALGLYYKGTELPGLKSVAIVGSRRCSAYGKKLAHDLGYELARRGFCVVSGLARGIDASAHEGALAAGGTTCAYLGSGVDIIYPPENRSLYEEVQRNGAVISEFPLGRKADKRTFPMRNRLISGSSQAVIVVETSERGGSMISARFAAEHGRILFAVPGRVDQEFSRGCHQLIRDGAILLRGVDDLLSELSVWDNGQMQQEEFSLEASDEMGSDPDVGCDLSPELESAFVAVQQLGPVGLDVLAAHLGRSPAELGGQLMQLELQGLVSKGLSGAYQEA